MTIINYAAPVNDWEEPEFTAIRQQLQLRPSFYKAERAAHPDTAPCPSWCHAVQSGDAHEIIVGHPMTAEHSSDVQPYVVASLYQGDPGRGQERVIQTATLEPHLEQIGQGAPVVGVMFRRWEGREQRYDELVRLTVTDARELIVALGCLADLADKG